PFDRLGLLRSARDRQLCGDRQGAARVGAADARRVLPEGGTATRRGEGARRHAQAGAGIQVHHLADERGRRARHARYSVSAGAKMTRVLIAALLVALASATALGADWPPKPVRIVAPFAAGGSSDTLGRLFAEALSAAYGKQFYVENR